MSLGSKRTQRVSMLTYLKRTHTALLFPNTTETVLAKLYEEVRRLKIEQDWIKNCRTPLKGNVSGSCHGTRLSLFDASVTDSLGRGDAGAHPTY